MMETLQQRAPTTKRKTAACKKIAAPRPLAVIALKNSSAHAMPGHVSLIPRVPEEMEMERGGAQDNNDSSYWSDDLEAESELQQIFGCAFPMQQPLPTAAGLAASLLSLSASSGGVKNRQGNNDHDDDDDMCEEEEETFVFELDDEDVGIDYSAFARDFPRLGFSPAPILMSSSGTDDEDGMEYPLPSRAHNPLALNTPFGLHKEIIEASMLPLAQQLQLSLGFTEPPQMPRTRNRSYSEPIASQFIDC